MTTMAAAQVVDVTEQSDSLAVPTGAVAQAGIHLAYVATYSPGNGVVMGGVLVTQANGLPMAFHYTEPVVPGRMQRLLYGKTLLPFLKQQVVTQSLMGAVDVPFALALTADDQLLEAPFGEGASLFSSTVPLVRVVGTSKAAIGAAGQRHALSAGSWLLQLKVEDSPVRVTWPSRAPEEAIQLAVLDTLTQAAQTLEVLEPFERLDKALQVLWEEHPMRRQVELA